MTLLFSLIPLIGFVFSMESLQYWLRSDAIEAIRLLRLRNEGRYLFKDITPTR